MWWIKAGIQEYIIHNWSLVKLGTTAAQKKLFFNLRRVKARLGELDEGDLSPRRWPASPRSSACGESR